MQYRLSLGILKHYDNSGIQVLFKLYLGFKQMIPGNIYKIETVRCWAISSDDYKNFFSVADLKLTMCHLYHLLKPIGRKAASHFVINRYSLPSHDAFLSPGTSRVATLNCILMAYIKFSTEFLWLFEIVVLLCLLGNIIYSWRVLALFIGIKLRVPCF